MNRSLKSAGETAAAPASASQFQGTLCSSASAGYACLSPEQLMNRFIALCVGQELHESGLVRVEELSDAQRATMFRALNMAEEMFAAKPAREALL